MANNRKYLKTKFGNIPLKLVSIRPILDEGEEKMEHLRQYDVAGKFSKLDIEGWNMFNEGARLHVERCTGKLVLTTVSTVHIYDVWIPDIYAEGVDIDLEAANAFCKEKSSIKPDSLEKYRGKKIPTINRDMTGGYEWDGHIYKDEFGRTNSHYAEYQKWLSGELSKMPNWYSGEKISVPDLLYMIICCFVTRKMLRIIATPRWCA